jgi:hypothetical protein
MSDSICKQLIFIALILANSVFAEPAPLENFSLVNGKWFDGEKFIKKTLYTVDGRFTAERPDRISREINLKGKYIVPPFGEAHNHNVAPFRFPQTLRHYIRSGVFYVKNPTNLPAETAVISGEINRPDSIDVLFSNGAITGSGGHPTQIATRQIDRGIWPEEAGEGGFYFTIDSVDDVESKLPVIFAGSPDFIKTYLVFSEEYERRKNDDEFGAWRGLNPDLLPNIVSKAHKFGLTVTCHVETAMDFRHAVIAGVDEITHVPGFRHVPDTTPDRFEIEEADAVAAAERNIRVVTTFTEQGERLRNDELNRRNINTLLKANVQLLIGSDNYTGNSTHEAIYLAESGTMGELTVLKLLSEVTPKHLFPDRKIGELRHGFEASFLALDKNPLKKLSGIRDISMAMKQGHLLEFK